LNALKTRHLDMALHLEGDEELHAPLKILLAELDALTKPEIELDADGAALDLLLSYGERLSAVLFAQALRREGKVVSLLDARELLLTDSHFGKAEPILREASPLAQQVKNEIQNAQLPEQIFLTQGFIGADAQGRTTTLGRGGSDYSAALFAEMFGASEVEIWTDVPGILTMDPRAVPSAKIIPEISFAEAAEMANFGAKVLHPATLWPAMRARIPVFIGSTFHPEQGGTRILPDAPAGPALATPQIRAIAIRKKQTLITVSSLRMLNAHGFLAKIFEVLARHRLSVDLVTTSEVSVALTIDETALGSAGKSILENTDMLSELRSFAEVQVEEDLSLVAIIGNSLNRSAGVAAKVFQAITEFNMRLICHGASEHNLCFLVSSAEAPEVAKRLHHVCIEWSSR
jgi:aspartate kinase